jgi:hypothetical protein
MRRMPIVEGEEMMREGEMSPDDNDGGGEIVAMGDKIMNRESRKERKRGDQPNQQWDKTRPS